MSTSCWIYKIVLFCCIILCLCCIGCATRQGRQGAAVGALTGATAGALLDSDNPWRGAAIGASLGSVFGGALTDHSEYTGYQYSSSTYTPGSYCQQQRYLYTPRSGYYDSYGNNNYAAVRGTAIGGITGAAAGVMLDHDNSWRGGLIGGALGSFLGGSIGAINSAPRIPVLAP